MTSKQDVTAAAAAAAVAAGQHLVTVAAQHGPASPQAQQAATAASYAVDLAEDAGCTRTDYDNARNTH
ncbi:hypothetical protein [Streptomyces sp. NPDC050848]|uniref:hypothetical protein n=1 Tax=Streptomyces sp. NPDC050848 TaxID=3155791 RepID=UPI0033E4590D